MKLSDLCSEDLDSLRTQIYTWDKEHGWKLAIERLGGFLSSYIIRVDELSMVVYVNDYPILIGNHSLSILIDIMYKTMRYIDNVSLHEGNVSINDLFTPEEEQ